MIPPSTGFSAHGCIFSRAYFLTLIAEVCCCYSNPRLEINGVLIDTAIPANNEPEVPPPEGWNPIVGQPVMLAAFRPYVFSPESCMRIYNQGGQTVNYQQEMGHNMMTNNAAYSNENLHKEEC